PVTFTVSDGSLTDYEDITITVIPVGPTITTYDAASGRSYFRAYGTYSDSWSDVDGDGGTLGTLPSECDTEISSEQSNAYTRLSYSDATGGDSDANRYTNPDEGWGDESTMIIHIWIDEAVSDINELSFTWEGYGDGAHTLGLYVFNYDTNNWDGGQGGYKDSGSGNSDFLLEWSTTSGIDSYINGNNQLAFMILDTSASENSFHDYAKLEVDHAPDLIAPVVSSPPDQTVPQGGVASITWNVVDTNPNVYWVLRNGVQVVAPASYTSGADIVVPVDTATLGDWTYTIVADDMAGNEGSDEVEIIIIPDETSPVITNVNAGSITQTSATITWDTDEPSDSLVKYGTTSGLYTDSTSDSAYVTSHSIGLSGLTSGTTYYYVVESVDPSSNSAQSAEYSFTTESKPPITTYDAASGRSYFRAYGTYSDSWSDVDGDGGTLGTLPSECDTEISSEQSNAYTRLSYSDATGGDSDANRYTNPDEGWGDESTMIIHIWIDEAVSDINELSFTWEGYGDGAHTLGLYVFNYDTNNWDGGQGGYKDSGSGNSDFLLEWSTTSGIDSYINGNNQLAFMILDTSASENSFHDYAKLDVTS
ncbi:MAG: fibronectin type III domain-containing protein, partial [Halobacteriota archaeon]|nr:fibronectin type III domain-containing protein [Halobacteriota archaeon]